MKAEQRIVNYRVGQTVYCLFGDQRPVVIRAIILRSPDDPEMSVYELNDIDGSEIKGRMMGSGLVRKNPA